MDYASLSSFWRLVLVVWGWVEEVLGGVGADAAAVGVHDEEDLFPGGGEGVQGLAD